MDETQALICLNIILTFFALLLIDHKSNK